MHTCLAFLPKTKSMASMTLDLPLPLGPTTEEKHCITLTTNQFRRCTLSGNVTYVSNHFLGHHVCSWLPNLTGSNGHLVLLLGTNSDLVEWAHSLYTGVGLKVLQNHLCYDKALRRHICCLPCGLLHGLDVCLV